MVDRCEKSADGAGDGQSHLAAPLRPRTGADAEQLRQTGPAADASRIARLPGRRASSRTAGRSRRCTGASCCRGPTNSPATADEANAAIDPNNECYWHFERRRLDGESIRDALLAVSGGLDRGKGGPHPFPPENSWGFTQHNPFQAVYETQPPQRLPDDAAHSAPSVPGAVRRRRPQLEHRPAQRDHGADAGAVLPQRPVRPRAGREVRRSNPGRDGR